MSNKLRSLKLDLGGSFPAKSEAVRVHANNLGLGKSLSYASFENRYLFIGDPDGVIDSSNKRKSFLESKYEQITAEKFLELTKEDVIEKPKTEKAWRYLIRNKNGSFFITAGFFVERQDELYYCNGDIYIKNSLISECIRYGEPIDVPYVEIKE